MKEQIKRKLKIILQFILNPRLILCFGIAWLITNGWSYILFAIGTYFKIGWMVVVASAYLTFLWFPFSPEKAATAAISIALLRLLFPHDEKTLAVLSQMYQKVKYAIKEKNSV